MAAPMPDLDVFLDGADDEEVAAPESREHVDRLLGRLARIRAAAARDAEHARLRIAQVSEWAGERLAVHEGAAAHIEALLAAWHEHLLSLDPRAKSVSLPNGTLKSRARSQSVKVADDEAFLAWAKEHRPDLVREIVTEAPDKKKAAAELEVGENADGMVVVEPATGEPVPGTVVEPAGRTFSIEVTLAFEDEQ